MKLVNTHNTHTHTHTGTRKGTTEYVNPCDAGEVSVEVSSLFNGEASSVVSSYPTDTYSKDEHGSWYVVFEHEVREFESNPSNTTSITRSYHYTLKNYDYFVLLTDVVECYEILNSRASRSNTGTA